MVNGGYSLQKACGLSLMFLPDLDRKLRYDYGFNVEALIALSRRSPKAPIVFNPPESDPIEVTDEELAQCQLIIGFCHEVEVDCEATFREDEDNFYVTDGSGPTYRISKSYLN